jgi:hypothetical protein
VDRKDERVAFPMKVDMFLKATNSRDTLGLDARVENWTVVRNFAIMIILHTLTRTFISQIYVFRFEIRVSTGGIDTGFFIDFVWKISSKRLIQGFCLQVTWSVRVCSDSILGAFFVLGGCTNTSSIG